MSDLIKLSLQKRVVGSVVVSPDVERELHCVLKRVVGSLAWLFTGENTPQEKRGLVTDSPL